MERYPNPNLPANEAQETFDPHQTGTYQELVAICDDFKSELQNGERAEFKTMGFNDKVDRVCYRLAERGDQDMAAFVRSLRFMHSFEKFMHTTPDGKPKNFHLPPYSDPFWAAVDVELNRQIVEYAAAAPGGRIEYGIHEPSAAPSRVHLLLASVDDYDIYKSYTHDETREERSVTSVVYTIAHQACRPDLAPYNWPEQG